MTLLQWLRNWLATPDDKPPPLEDTLPVPPKDERDQFLKEQTYEMQRRERMLRELEARARVLGDKGPQR